MRERLEDALREWLITRLTRRLRAAIIAGDVCAGRELHARWTAEMAARSPAQVARLDRQDRARLARIGGGRA